MVEIELLENLNNDIFYFKANLVGKKTWSQTLKDGELVKNIQNSKLFCNFAHY